MYCILTRFCTELRLPTCIKELMMMMMTRARTNLNAALIRDGEEGKGDERLPN